MKLPLSLGSKRLIALLTYCIVNAFVEVYMGSVATFSQGLARVNIEAEIITYTILGLL